MRSTVSRWLPAIRRNTVRTAVLGAAALAVGLGVAAGPAHSASAAPAGGDHGAPPAATAPAGDSKPATDQKAAEASTKDTAVKQAADKSAADKAASDKAAADKAAADKAAADKAASDKAAADKAAADKAAAEKAAAPAPAIALGYDFHNQPNYYYCGPAATRIALTSHGKVLSFDQVAGLLGTTTNGTNSAEDITRVLNSQLGAGRYHTTAMPGRPNPAQMDQMRNDIVRALNQGDPVVANVAGTVTDTAGEVHSYEGGHYLTVVGYFEGGGMVTIADPADTVGKPTYQLTTAELAKWVGTRGYSS